MGALDNYKRQHQEVLAMATTMSTKLDAATVAAEAPAIRAALSTMAGKLLMHLALEDKSLYPRLIASTNAKARAVAQAFFAQHGGLEKALKAFDERWRDAATIQAKAGDFVTETKALFGVLQERVRREEAELYPLAE